MNSRLLINKKVIRLFKYILLSPQLEQCATFFYLLLFFIILIFFVTDNFNHIGTPTSEKKGILSTQQYFEKNISVARFIDFLNSDFQTNYINSTNSLLKVLGGVRVTQYRIIKPPECYDNSSQTRFSTDCNNFFRADWANSMRTSIDVSSSHFCIENDCSEFVMRFLDFATRSTKWKAYPNRALFVTIPITNFASDAQKLISNDWLSSEETVTILLEYNTIDLRFLNIFNSQIYLEMPEFATSHFTFRFDTVMYRSSHDFLYDVLAPVYFMVLLLLTFKGIFEMGYFTNKMTGILNLITYVTNLILATCFLLENAQYRKIFTSDLNPNFRSFLQRPDYLPVNEIFFYRYIESILFVLCIVPFPFKIFELVSWINFFQILQKYINSLYRTVIGYSIYIISVAIITVGWALGFYLILRDYESDFENFYYSLFGLFFAKTVLLDTVKEMEFFSIDMINCILKLLRFILFAYFLSIITYCVMKAASFDYSQFYSSKDKNINENLTNISTKIDKFVKKYLPNLQQDDFNKNLQIIVWLSSGVFGQKIENDLVDMCNNKNIKLLIFQEVKEVIQFMNYLFKLKPNLAFRSENFFRILIEFSLDHIENNPKTLVLRWLGDYGSRVSVFIFLTEIDNNMSGILQRVYKYVYLSNSVDDVRDFLGFKKISEIKFNRENERKINTISEIESSVLSHYSHSFDFENSMIND